MLRNLFSIHLRYVWMDFSSSNRFHQASHLRSHTDASHTMCTWGLLLQAIALSHINRTTGPSYWASARAPSRYPVSLSCISSRSNPTAHRSRRLWRPPALAACVVLPAFLDGSQSSRPKILRRSSKARVDVGKYSPHRSTRKPSKNKYGGRRHCWVMYIWRRQPLGCGRSIQVGSTTLRAANGLASQNVEVHDWKSNTSQKKM